jgi:Protein of unknown function (DUF3761)
MAFRRDARASTACSGPIAIVGKISPFRSRIGRGNKLSEHREGVGPALGVGSKGGSSSSSVAGILFLGLCLSAYGGFRLANPLGSLSFLYCILAGVFWLNLVGRFLFSFHRGRHKGIASLLLCVLPFVVLFFFTKSVRELFIAPALPSSGPTAVCLDGTYSYSRHQTGTCSWHGGVRYWER